MSFCTEGLFLFLRSLQNQEKIMAIRTKDLFFLFEKISPLENSVLARAWLQSPLPETAICACQCYLLRHQFLTIRIDATRYVKARSHPNFQFKTLEKYKISRSRSRSVFFPFQKKKVSQTK